MLEEALAATNGRGAKQKRRTIRRQIDVVAKRIRVLEGKSERVLEEKSEPGKREGEGKRESEGEGGWAWEGEGEGRPPV